MATTHWNRVSLHTALVPKPNPLPARRYDIGAFSFALLYFKDDPKLQLSQLQVALLVGQFNLVAALGCLIAGTVSDALGRRTSLMLGNLLNIVGTLIFAASESFGSMFLGRFVMGLGAGIAFMGPELYAAELSPPHVRGLTSTFGELFINFGILIGYLSGCVPSLPPPSPTQHRGSLVSED